MSEEDKVLTAEEVEEIRKEREELRLKLEEKEKAEKAIIEELQSERTQRQKAQEELKGKEGATESPDDEDPEKVVERVLTRRQEEERKSSQEQALREFRKNHPEFNEENDPAGIAFKKFEDTLSKFNLSDVKSKEDFSNRFGEVYEFMNRKSTPSESKNFHSGTKDSPGSSPREDDTVVLSDAEKKVMEQIGWTKEKFLEQKAKRPHFVASLLQHRR